MHGLPPNSLPARKDLATGATDEVGNRKTLVPDGDKWGARFEELVQLTGLLEREVITSMQRNGIQGS